eukprot:1447570-Amphidinium_carterae.1
MAPLSLLLVHNTSSQKASPFASNAVAAHQAEKLCSVTLLKAWLRPASGVLLDTDLSSLSTAWADRKMAQRELHLVWDTSLRGLRQVQG